MTQTSCSDPASLGFQASTYNYNKIFESQPPDEDLLLPDFMRNDRSTWSGSVQSMDYYSPYQATPLATNLGATHQVPRWAKDTISGYNTVEGAKSHPKRGNRKLRDAGINTEGINRGDPQSQPRMKNQKPLARKQL
ncbi:hypothetical protein HO173_012100 [Letharia columbiana]|uniref:Uncharacterized protein n=1 Tax=Letharia columbiana TaxID=112416 RepID=A0A8H6FGQ3_9LECA|nr:uncharacterized protein HO173_012100 [Letharia columbiana]KAF6227660.1 hypothetical protein HO173_012100 [Letharia columbiana]